MTDLAQRIGRARAHGAAYGIVPEARMHPLAEWLWDKIHCYADERGLGPGTALGVQDALFALLAHAAGDDVARRLLNRGEDYGR